MGQPAGLAPEIRDRIVLDAQLDGTTRRRVEAADVELHRDRLRFPEVVRRHHEGVARALAVLRERERRLSSRQRRVDGLVRRRPADDPRGCVAGDAAGGRVTATTDRPSRQHAAVGAVRPYGHRGELDPHRSGFAQVGTSTSATFSSTTLTANTTYRFRVRAC